MSVNISSRKKITALVFTLLAIVVYFSVVAISRIGETRVSIVVIPDDAKVTINGSLASAGNKYLKPGDYTFTATKTGWSTDVLSIKVGTDSVEVGLVPDPNSESAAKWLKDNPDIQLQREAIGGKQAQLTGDLLTEQTPLIKALPYEDIYGPFRVDFGPSEARKNGIFIEVSSSTPPGRAKFLQWLKQQGEDPTDLEIRYFDFANPFLEAGE